MNRTRMLDQLSAVREWDVCVIGGGATGLGIAVDAASRGYRTILLERFDFAKGTSSRSTKLVHGGVRYLQQGNIKLVFEALKERGLLKKNAPHLVKNQSFVIPNYKWWENPFYGIGLKLYDWMSGSLGLGKSQFLSKDETLEYAPTLDPDGLRGGVLYHDGQFDDARLAVHLAMTAADNGGVILNYFGVEGLMKANGVVCGVEARDSIGGETYEIAAKAVINATGVFTDAVRAMDEPGVEPIVTPSQGIHLVFDREFLPSETAIMIPKTEDGRVLFAVPWHDRIIVGTTDTKVELPSVEPRPMAAEIDFILHHMARYLTKSPTLADVRSMFAGLRPLVSGHAKSTAALSREHHISISDSELITITGGKWTTYRRMAEDALEIAAAKAGLDERPCVTKSLRIHGYREGVDFKTAGYVYGSDEEQVSAIAKERPEWAERIHPRLSAIKAEVVWAARQEMCSHVEDFLARRTRSLLLDARASIEAAPAVAAILAGELGHDDAWIANEVEALRAVASGYSPSRG